MLVALKAVPIDICRFAVQNKVKKKKKLNDANKILYFITTDKSRLLLTLAKRRFLQTVSS